MSNVKSVEAGEEQKVNRYEQKAKNYTKEVNKGDGQDTHLPFNKEQP